MTKEVLISISGLQVSPESETDTVEMIAPGEYYFRNNKHYLVYNEVEEGQTEPSTKNVIKFSNDYMEVIKKGPMSVHMVFEKDKKNISYYNTPFGSLLIGIEAKDFSYQEPVADSSGVGISSGEDLSIRDSSEISSASIP